MNREKYTKYLKKIQNMIVYINYTNNTNNYAIFKNRLGRTFLVPNTSTSLQTTLASVAHLAEGQFLDEEQTLNNAKSLIYRAGTRRPTISRMNIMIIIIIIIRII
jgi:hypothetical protein